MEKAKAETFRGFFDHKREKKKIGDKKAMIGHTDKRS